MSQAADSKSNGSHKKKGSTPVSEAETSHNLKGGESVEWKLRGSIHHGRIITKLTEPTTVNDSMVAASVKEPKWLVEEDIESKRMCALVPSALFHKGELEIKEKEAAAKIAEAEANSKEKEKEKEKESKAKVPVALAGHKQKESGSGVMKQAEEKKEPASAAAAASKIAPKVAPTKV